MVDSLNGGMVSLRQDKQGEHDLFLFLSQFPEERDKKQSTCDGVMSVNGGRWQLCKLIRDILL